MKLLTGMIATTLLLAGAGASHAVVRIADDRGGQIDRYVDQYEKLRASGQTIIIDGLCASACTIVLGAIPYDRICVTPNANLAFHAAWDFGTRGRAIPNREATKDLFSMYPSQVQRWIANRGGLTPRTIFLRGRQLATMYRPCYLHAQAAVTRKRLNRLETNVGLSKAHGSGAKALGHASR
jgi:ATP-dependent protease ClpP protease subunit